MKTLKNLLAMIIAIIVIAEFASCKKDDAEPTRKGIPFLYGDTLNADAKKAVTEYVYYLFVQVGDTVWYLDRNGLPIKEKDPDTDLWNYKEIKYTEATVQQQLASLLFSSAELLIQQRTKTNLFFAKYPTEQVYLTFPKVAEIMEWKTVDGKIFEQEISELDNVRQRLVDYPTHTLSQEVEAIHTAAKPTWGKANSEYFLDQVKNPSNAPSKSNAMRAKAMNAIARQAASINEANIPFVIDEINDLVERGIKPNPALIDKFAKELTTF